MITDAPKAAPYARHHQYESFAEFVADAQSCGTDSSHRSDWAFGSFKNEKTAARMIVAGESSALVYNHTQAARERIELAIEASDMRGLSRRRRLVWSDQGDPDTDRVLDRRELWACESTRGKEARIVRVGINAWISCQNTEQDFARLAGTACAICDAVEKLGYGSEVWGILAAQHSAKSDYHYAYSFPLKRSGEPLDINRIGTIGCPATMRHYGFALNNRDNTKLGLPVDSLQGYCRTEESALKQTIGVDYLIARSWHADHQEDIIRGIRSLVE